MVKVPGPRHARGVRAAGRCRSPTSRAPTTGRPDRRHQRAHDGRRHLIWAELDSNASRRRDDRAADPPGRELARGRALHRRAAQPQGRRREAASSRAAPSASTATGSHRLEGVRAAPPAHGVASSGSLRKAGHRPPRASTWPGTSPSRAATRCRGGCCRSATAPSPSSATATCATSRWRARRRRSRWTGDRGHARAASPTCAAAWRARHGAVLPRRGGLPVRVALRARPGRPARRTPGNVQDARYICNIPRSAAPTNGRRARRSTATACSARRARRAPATWRSSGNENNVLVCAPTGSACRRGRAQRDRRSRRTCRASRPSPTASSRASSTSCSSGRHDDPPGRASPRTRPSGTGGR